MLDKLENITEVYPTLFSEKRLSEWRALFCDQAIISKTDAEKECVIWQIDEIMPILIQDVENHETCHEEWENVSIKKYGNAAVVTANYTVTLGNEVRKGTDVVMLAHNRLGWKIISLVYEEAESFNLM